MSHYSVMVITPEKPNADSLAALLMPYHEFECTGINKYIQEFDETEKFRKEYEEATRNFLVNVTSGEKFSPYDDQFYRDPTPEEQEKHKPMMGSGGGGGISWSSRDWGDGLGYRAKVRFIPDGYEEREIPVKEVQTFLEYVEYDTDRKTVLEGEQPDIGGDADEKGDHKYGYIVISAAGEVVKVIDRTNPNKKWDWYQVGGRYSGKLHVKPGAAAEKGKKSWTNEGEEIVGFDSAKVDDLDLEGMRLANIANQKKYIDAAITELAAQDISREDALAIWKGMADNIAATRAEWESAGEGKGAFHQFIKNLPEGHPVRKAVVDTQVSSRFGDWGAGIPENEPDPYAYADKRPPLTAFAVLNGEWHESGSMGWWGMVAEEKDHKDWEAYCGKVVADLQPDQYITIIDCHI